MKQNNFEMQPPVWGQNYQFQMRKPKRKIVKEEIIIAEEGYFLKTRYDDWQEDLHKIIYGEQGEFVVAKLKFPAFLSLRRTYFLIGFPESKHCCIVSQNDGKTRILEKLHFSGIHFWEGISDLRLANVIYKFIQPQFIMTQKCFEVPVLGGWNGAHYCTAREVEYFQVIGERMNLPIQNVVFFPFETKFLRSYLEKLKQIKSLPIRFTLMVFTFASLMTTILDSLGINWNRCLYIVTEGSQINAFLCQICQTFRRHTLIPMEIETTEKRVREQIFGIKDELKIFGISQGNNSSNYKKKAVRMKVQNLEKYVNQEYALGHPYDYCVKGAAIILCDFRPLEKEQVLFLENSDIMHECGAENQEFVNSVFGEFVRFVECNYKQTESLLKEIYEQKNTIIGNTKAVFEGVFEVVKRFFDTFGINLEEELSLENTSLYRKNALENTGTLYSEAKKMVREEIAKVYICKKHHNMKAINPLECVIYDETYIWVPCVLLWKWLEGYGLIERKRELLAMLRENGDILCDAEGYSRKIEISLKRFEAYQFRRDFFDEPGELDLVLLGKEMEA